VLQYLSDPMLQFVKKTGALVHDWFRMYAPL
jgi:hypothetical protein